MYFEYYILGIILLPAIILAIYAELKVTSTYKKYLKVQSEKHLTGKEVAELILNAGGVNAEIISTSGTLTDYYDSKKKVLALSKANYNSTSISSLGVAAHECGHALQDKDNYFPLKFRHVAVTAYNISSKLLLPIILIGLCFDFLLLIPQVANIFIYSGVIVFGLSLLASLVTLPVEFNASNRAIKILGKSEILNNTELRQAKQVLNAAALTYVAAFLFSLLNFLRFFLIFLRNRD